MTSVTCRMWLLPKIATYSVFAASRAERHQFGAFEFQRLYPLKKLHFRGIGIGVARLDEIDAQLVQRFADFQFVFDRKGNVRALRAVSQGGIEYL